MAQKVLPCHLPVLFSSLSGPRWGGIIRKGGLGAPVVVSIFLFIVYYIIWMMGGTSGPGRGAGAVAGYVDFFRGPVAVRVLVLTYTAMTDSAVMSSESYTNFIKKIIGFFKKKDKKCVN